MLFPASQKIRITRGAGQDDPGFMDSMNCPGFWTASQYPPWPCPSNTASMSRTLASTPWEHATRI